MTQATSRWKVFFSNNPLVGALGTSASVLGLILAVYLYFVGREAPHLQYYNHPDKVTIVKSKQTGMVAYFEGKLIPEDVTASQVTIWNEGNETIRPVNILAPLTLRTHPTKPILEARVLNRSREEIEFNLDSAQMWNGAITLDWTLLEHLDGSTIQLIHLGGPETSIVTEATIEKQGKIKGFTNDIANSFLIQVSFLVTIIALGVIAMMSSSERFGKFLRNAPVRFFQSIYYILVLLYLAYLGLEVLSGRAQPPSFEVETSIIVTLPELPGPPPMPTVVPCSDAE